MPTDERDTERVLARVRDAFAALVPGAHGAVEDLVAEYDEQVVFQDPLQRVEGRRAFADLNHRLLRHARVLRVRVHDSVAAGEHAFMTWEMDYARKLGPTMTIAGVSHLHLRDGKVVHHRDYWDVASAVVGVVPGARRIYSALAARVA